MKFGFLVSGFVVLLIGSYIDCIRGPLIPLLANEFILSYSKASLFLICGNMGALSFSLLLIPLFSHFGEKRVTLGLLFFLALLCILVFKITGLFSLLAFGAALGIVQASLGTAGNILTIRGTEERFRSRALSGLHAMFGVGAAIAPLGVASVLGLGLRWTWIFTFLIPVILAIAIFIYVKTPSDGPILKGSLRVKTHLSRGQIVMLLLFACYVAYESLISMWMVTFLVEQERFPMSKATVYLSLFFSILLLTRILCIFFHNKSFEPALLVGCLSLSILFFCLGHLRFYMGFILAGLLGPFFPVLLARITSHFPNQWRELTIWVNFAIQCMLALMHLTIGKFADQFGLNFAYQLPTVFGFMTLALLAYYYRFESRQSASKLSTA